MMKSAKLVEKAMVGGILGASKGGIRLQYLSV